MTRAQRLLELLQILRRHRYPVSGAALASELGISLSSLHRDIATLQAQGARIEGAAGLGYQLRAGFMLPPSKTRENTMNQNWVAVASAEHVRIGRETGFMQVCHGKAAPLCRIHPGDRVVYYSPTVAFRGKDKLQAFTAIGVVKSGDPYAFDMGGGFCPFRRDVQWARAVEAPIKPLLDELEFSSGKKNWGYQLRFGLFPIAANDMEVIARAMQATLPV